MSAIKHSNGKMDKSYEHIFHRRRRISNIKYAQFQKKQINIKDIFWVGKTDTGV